MAELVLKEEVYEVIGAAMEVYYQLGRGFLEPLYQEAFEIELSKRGLPFEPQAELTIEYKGQPLEKKYVADLVCFSQIVVELKALDRLTGIDEAQLLNYLKMTRMRVGLLINFGSQVTLEWKRYII
ncbi:MAG: GxxExxY protein [Pyrinomonadaceae bacterium]|nr:GxxExxY protein [Pyrinomonadaceae bacterium]